MNLRDDKYSTDNNASDLVTLSIMPTDFFERLTSMRALQCRYHAPVIVYTSAYA
jgi:hypothetical protein